MEEHHDIGSTRADIDGASVPPFDLEAEVAPGIRARDLVEAVADMQQRDVPVYFGEFTRDLLKILSPVSFVRCVLHWPGAFLFFESCDANRRRLPFLSLSETEALTRKFWPLQIDIPSIGLLVAVCRTRMVRRLRETGVSPRVIANRFRITPRWVRALTSGMPKAPPHG